jgi:hypothetical protein
MAIRSNINAVTKTKAGERLSAPPLSSWSGRKSYVVGLTGGGVGAVRGCGPTGGAAAGGTVTPGLGIVTVPGGIIPGVTTVAVGAIDGISPRIGPSVTGTPDAGGHGHGGGSGLV